MGLMILGEFGLALHSLAVFLFFHAVLFTFLCCWNHWYRYNILDSGIRYSSPKKVPGSVLFNSNQTQARPISSKDPFLRLPVQSK